jgi:hypothetical protein
MLETHRLIVKSLLIGRKTTASKADCCSTARGVNASARDTQDVWGEARATWGSMFRKCS